MKVVIRQARPDFSGDERRKKEHEFFLYHFLRGVLGVILDENLPVEPVKPILVVDATSKQFESLQNSLPAHWFLVEKRDP